VEQEQALIGTLLKVREIRHINSLLALTRELRGFRAGGVQIWWRRGLKDYEGHLVSLPSFKSGRPTRRVNELLQVLHAQVMFSLRKDLAPRRIPASLEQARFYLELCDFVCAAKRGYRSLSSSCASTVHRLSWGK
jgi:hypothetical protein